MQPGTRLGHWEVLGALGRGGMGEVWLARDTRLGRDVALKTLPPEFSGDAGRLGRFEREARLLASLNHPGIAAIHGLEDHHGTRFLVLELIEGDTLEDRIARGPLPTDEALALTFQIAEALEAAHGRGVLHRDLKPANVKITPDGRTKILDFGLAKSIVPEEAGAVQTDSPTLSAVATQQGVVLGTAPYMSPEQAKGRTVDHRTDIWALGCVLYEMLAGRRAFGGGTTLEVLAAVLEREPDWQAIDRPGVPPGAVRVLRRCLARDPAQRFHSARDVALALEAASAPPSPSAAAPAGVRRSIPSWALLLVLAGALAAVAVALSSGGAPTSAATPVRLHIELAHSQPLANSLPSLALSPDGSRIAYVGGTFPDSVLYVRELDGLDAVALPGTDGATSPFFSADGRELAFVARGRLRKMTVTGAGSQVLAEVASFFGGSWGTDGTIVFAPAAGPLHRVPEAGGASVAVTSLDAGEAGHYWPQVLGDGGHVLFTSATRGNDFENASIEVVSLATGARTRVMSQAYFGRYTSGGSLLFVRSGTLYAAPFDIGMLALTGEPRPVVDRLLATPTSGAADLAFTRTGHLVYRTGEWAFAEASAVGVDRRGTARPLLHEPGLYYSPRFSPDGTRLAMQVGGGSSASYDTDVDVWVYDLERGTAAPLAASPAPDYMPVWTPDGEHIVFSSKRDGRVANLYRIRADGSGPVERLATSGETQWADSMSPDGRRIVIHQVGPARRNLWQLALDEHGAAGTLEPLLDTPYQTWRGEVSPDGRWIAYTSIESGSPRIWVSPFPGLERRWLVSTDSDEARNLYARWSRAAPELFYWTGERMMVVPYAVDGGTFRAGTPSVLFEGDFAGRGWPEWDVSPDGERFVMFTSAQGPAARIVSTGTVMVLNWFAEE